MCGIFGLITNDSFRIGKTLVEAGIRLSYRGYDSVGIGTEDKGEITLKKDAGKIPYVDKKMNLSSLRGNKGLLQLRWATFGYPSKVNAQPHYDCDCDIVGCHNGNILNTHELNKMFKEEGHIIRSENDGEVCVHAVERYINKGQDSVTALRNAAKDLKGYYSFAFYKKGENKIYCIKKGISLILGVSEDNKTSYVSSDLPCLLPLTKRIIRIKDDEIAELSPTGIKMFNAITGDEIKPIIEIIKDRFDDCTKEGFPYFMIKEITEQPKRIVDMFENLKKNGAYKKFVDKLTSSKKTFFVAAGTSYHACVGASYIFNQLAHLPVFPVIASSFIEGYGNTIDKDTTIVLVSQSGETKDVVNVLNYVRMMASGAPILSIINVKGSTIDLESDIRLLICAGFERSVPATKTYMNQLAIFYRLCVSVALERGKISEPMEKKGMEFLNKTFPEMLKKQLEDVKEPCKKVAEGISKVKDLYVLGFGLTHATALEAALKFKEVTYTHAEGCLSPEFKHGPLSIVEKGYPVIFFVSPKDHWEIRSHINEVKCRGGKTIVFAEKDDQMREEVDEYVEIPTLDKDLKYMNPLLQVIPLQLLSYYGAITRKIDPDTPRNLSKTLTVD